MTDIVASQNTDLSFWDTLYRPLCAILFVVQIQIKKREKNFE
jgi:hypothetical protein